jgi:hypothetical protein
MNSPPTTFGGACPFTLPNTIEAAPIHGASMCRSRSASLKVVGRGPASASSARTLAGNLRKGARINDLRVANHHYGGDYHRRRECLKKTAGVARSAVPFALLLLPGRSEAADG